MVTTQNTLMPRETESRTSLIISVLSEGSWNPRLFILVICCMAAGLVSFAAAQTPSSILDLSNWKITMPYDTEEISGNPDEIFQPDLAEFSDPDYFFVNPEGTGIIFRANCGAASTTNSNYPRSELREMRMDDNTDEVSWSTDDGVVHRMEITQAITHLPDVKRHVVAGQIHGGGDDLTVFRLEGEKLFVDLNGNDGPVLTDSYTPGDVFTVAFTAENGVVRYEYNGEPVRDDNGKIFELQSGNAEGCYFKAGCYTQSNIEKGDEPEAYGEVIIYDLFVAHGDEIHTRRVETAGNSTFVSGTSSGMTLNSVSFNPVLQLLSIQYNVDREDNIRFIIRNGRGAIVRETEAVVETKGHHMHSMFLPGITGGRYFLTLEGINHGKTRVFTAN